MIANNFTNKQRKDNYFFKGTHINGEKLVCITVRLCVNDRVTHDVHVHAT